MANAFLNVAGLVAALLPLSMIGKVEDPRTQTSVYILVGPGKWTDGNTPSLAVWDKNHNRVAQRGSGKKDRIGADVAGGEATFQINNKQNGMKPAKPEYLSVAMTQKDAICISAIVATGGGSQWTWTGDIGFTCGAQWYASNATMGNSNIPMRCAWLDSDHTNGIVASAVSLHMPDFSGEIGLMTQYKEDDARLCRNTARMTFHSSFHPDGFPKFFSPPLEYSAETNQGDPSQPYTAGALLKPNQGVDRKTRAYADGTNMNIRSLRSRHMSRQDGQVMGIKNLYPERLTVSHHKRHSARELCEDKMAMGPDFVSKEEGLFCDMATETLWPLCASAQDSECFDLDIQKIRTRKSKRDAPTKAYTTMDEWR